MGQLLADILLRDNTERRAATAARLIDLARTLIETSEIERRITLIEQRLSIRNKL